MRKQKNSIMEDEYAWMCKQPKYQMYIDIGKSLAAHGLGAGLDRAAQNIAGNFKDEPMVHSAKHFENEAINRDAEWGDKLKYNIGYKGGEMLPELAASGVAGKGAGIIVSFANERGKVRQDVLRKGEDKKVADRLGNFWGHAKVGLKEMIKRELRN